MILFTIRRPDPLNRPLSYDVHPRTEVSDRNFVNQGVRKKKRASHSARPFAFEMQSIDPDRRTITAEPFRSLAEQHPGSGPVVHAGQPSAAQAA